MNKLTIKNSLVHKIQFLGISLLGVFSAIYALLNRNFAELCIQLSFLDFPIFVGEILLAVCLILWIAIERLESKKFNRGHVFILIYCGWLLFHAVIGYRDFGPYALRNSALFYYPLFFFIAVIFYNKRFFSQTVLIVSLLTIACSFLHPEFSRYFYITYLAIGLLFLLKLKNRKVQFLFMVVLLAAFPYKLLLGGARAHLISALIALFFFSFFLIFCIMNARKIWKLGAVLLTFMLLFLAIQLSANKTKLMSLTKPQGMVVVYERNQAIIDKKKDKFQFKPIEPKTYNPARMRFKDSIKREFKKDNNVIVTEDLTAEVGRSESQLSQLKAQVIQKEKAKLDTNRDGEISLAEEKPLVHIEEIVIQEVGGLRSQLTAILNSVAGSLRTKKPDEIKVLLEQTQIECKNIFESFRTNLKTKVVNIYQEETTRIDDEKILETVIKLLDKNLNDIWLDYSNGINEMKWLHQVELQYSNILFRYYIWKDMVEELYQKRAWWGVGMGHPQRSRSIEILGIAWGEWTRDGWICPHNSFLHMIYRTGIIGFMLILFIYYGVFYCIKITLRQKSIIGLCLMTGVIYWMMLSNFLVILELPYTAIPFWSLFGITFAYCKQLESEKKVVT